MKKKQSSKIMENIPDLLINGIMRKAIKKPVYENFKVKTQYGKGVHSTFHNQINPKLSVTKHKLKKITDKTDLNAYVKPKYNSIKKGKVTDNRVYSDSVKLTRSNKVMSFNR